MFREEVSEQYINTDSSRLSLIDLNDEIITNLLRLIINKNDFNASEIRDFIFDKKNIYDNR